MDRWAICLDIEGTSTIFPKDEMRFFQAFDSLLKALFIIGTKVYPETPNRLFAHQLGGDGLLIVSEFAEGSPEVPISIATLLLQVLLTHNSVGKAGIAAGSFADIHSCCPSLGNMIKSSHNVYRIGRGVLTIFPAMGTALINAHRLASHAPSGSRLAADSALLEILPPGVVLTKKEAHFAIVDWVHTRTCVMENILSIAGLELPTPHELERSLIDYVCKISLPGETEWGHNTLFLNGCE